MIARLSVIVLACAAVGLLAEEFAHDDAAIGLKFPKVVGDMKNVDFHQYDKPGLGYSLRYAGPDLLKIDVYVYDKNLPAIPDGVDNDVVKTELKEIGDVIQYYQRKGDYTGVKELAKDTALKDQPVSFLMSKYELKQPKEPGAAAFDGVRISESYVVGFRKNFIKVRATYRKDKQEAGEKSVSEFVAALSKLLSSAPKPE